MSPARSKKVGVALGGGGARGLAHIGVLQVLDREKVPIDMISGTSIGSIIGALYALGRGTEWIENLVRELGSRRIPFFRELSVSRSGLIRGRKIEQALKSMFGNAQFKDLKIPFACVATDVRNGEEIVIREGLLWKATRASSSLPLLVSAAKLGDRYLVDGALLNPVPARVVRQMGADFIIAVNVSPDTWAHEVPNPSIFAVLAQLMHIASHQILEHSLEDADVVIHPDTSPIGLGDFHRVDECIKAGRLAAEEALPQIREMLKSRRKA